MIGGRLIAFYIKILDTTIASATVSLASTGINRPSPVMHFTVATFGFSLHCSAAV